MTIGTRQESTPVMLTTDDAVHSLSLRQRERLLRVVLLLKTKNGTAVTRILFTAHSLAAPHPPTEVGIDPAQGTNIANSRCGIQRVMSPHRRNKKVMTILKGLMIHSSAEIRSLTLHLVPMVWGLPSGLPQVHYSPHT